MANCLQIGLNKKRMFNKLINTIMNRFKIYALALLSVVFVFSNCTEEVVEEPINEAQVLVEYLESTNSPAGKDYVANDLPSLITATDLKTAIEGNKAYVIDIRDAAAFASGHIANAVNVTTADLLAHIKTLDMTKYDKVAIACYTGQTASWSTSLLRILGYSKVFALKWGMCSWHTDFATQKWTATIANGNAYASQFVTTATAKGTAGALPTLTTGKTAPKDILEARVNAIFAEGFSKATVSNTVLFGALSTYYVVNYWSELHYNEFGHIPGAMQYTPKTSLKLAADLKTLPTNKPVAVYCYSGQTSAFMAAYLRVLGYDAKTVLSGTNAMAYDKMLARTDMAGSTFKAAAIMDYAYVK